MGRRKIEIKPIRDDRNRSVTFLKRKGGLFKKAHELSVLCSVDVAVVIFGNNKKLYEYSSSDINDIIGRFNYYGGAHEHKGPEDFADKQGGDDDDDDEGGEEVDEQRGTPVPDPMMHRQMQHHPGFQHVRHGTPSGSPPMHNGAMPHFQRGPSPLPPGMSSRPSSRSSAHPGHSRHPSSNLVHQTPPQHPPTTVAPPGNYAYMPNPSYYNQPPPPSQRPPQYGHPSQATYPPPHPAPGGPHPAQMQAVMMHESRRSSMPPAIPGQPLSHERRHPSQDHLQAPPPPPPPPQPHPSPRMSQQTPPQPQPRPSIPTPQPSQFQSPPMPQPKPLPSYAKANIFTPIDDSRSMLAQHWGSTSTSNAEARPEEGAPRPQSVDMGAMNRERTGLGLSTNGGPPRPASPRRATANKSPGQGHHHQASAPSPRMPPAPSRSNTMQSNDAKRPRLKVQIPNEASGDEGGAGTADEVSTSQPSNASSGQHHGPAHGVVLPPPSPSASALLSAGAQGPPNPFARPAPPMSTNPHAANRDPATTHETPMSALPSRFVSDNLLPSPSTFYPEWGFGRSGDTMLPSPLNFQTPTVTNGQGWRESGNDEKKRPAEGELEGGEAGKKAKS